MLYHVLLQGDNLSRFLGSLGVGTSARADLATAEVYVEYSYLRDAWHERRGSIDEDNALKRQVILEMIRPRNVAALETLPVPEFNAFFGATPRPSATYIQSPSTWNTMRLARSLEDRDEFLRACRFKWAFRIKLDLVIQTSLDTGHCVEAKWESAEGQYPTTANEIKEFRLRSLKPVAQTELQRYMFKDLLGMHMEYWLLVKKSPMSVAGHQVLTWRNAFAGLDLRTCPRFITQWIQALEGEDDQKYPTGDVPQPLSEEDEEHLDRIWSGSLKTSGDEVFPLPHNPS